MIQLDTGASLYLEPLHQDTIFFIGGEVAWIALGYDGSTLWVSWMIHPFKVVF